ncbi:MAG: response regulator [Acidobacteria bacterium]|nr:response regulator [Acidobacteriota bacterium]
MIAFQLKNPAFCTRLAEACAHIGRIAVSFETLTALQEFLRFNSVAVIILECDHQEEECFEAVRAMRAELRTATTPIIWIGTPPQQVGQDQALLPDVVLPPGELEGRIEAELQRLLRGSTEIDFAMPSPERQGPTRILLIDDSLTYRMMLNKALTAAGYEVTLAATGEAGLDAAFQSSFSAVMVDNMLPGIQGAAVIRRLRAEAATRRTPCLLLTASEDPNNELEALEAGADTFVRKDEAVETILLRLAAVLRTSSEPSAFQFAPVSSRRVLLAGKQVPQLLALRELLLADGIVVVEESSVETIYARAVRDPLDAIVLALSHAETVGLCTRLKESARSAKMRVLVLESAEDAASLGQHDQQAAALQAGADDFVPLSMPARNLRARLETQLRRKYMEDENRALHDYVLRQQVDAEMQRKLAAERFVHARELQSAKEAVEKEAREAEAARLQLEKVMEALPQIVLMATGDGTLLSYNRRWTQYVGEAPSSNTLEMWRRVMPPEDAERYLAARAHGLQATRGFTGEFRLRGADGQYRWFYIQAIPMLNPAQMQEGEQPFAARWLATCTDIHDRKLAEEALRRTEKLAATGRLAASIAHEINNPLEAVTNLLFLVEHATASQPEVREYVISAQQQLGRVSEISKKTLAFYRESKNPAPVDIAGLIEETRDVYAARLRQKKMPFEVDIRTHKKPVGLSGELRQVVSNMIANAIDASPDGSTISVRVHESRNWGTGRKGIRILVCDRGPGIPANLRADLFKPFVTTKGQNGTGLGLWVAHSIAARHEGELRFWTSDRAPKTGTCFSFFLPWDGKVTTSDDSIGEMMKQIGSELLHKEV